MLGNKRTTWLMWDPFFFFKHFQALQSQKRSKPMARCSAVINSSTGFSHVLIIGSGQCVCVPPSLFTTTQTKIQLCLIDFLKTFLFQCHLPLFMVNTPAGPAGLVCAETLRQEGFTDRIVMCTMDRHPPYDRPKLSKVCTQTLTT